MAFQNRPVFLSGRWSPLFIFFSRNYQELSNRIVGGSLVSPLCRFLNLPITALPLTGSPEQQCRIVATTFYLLKIFLRTTYLKEQLNFACTTL